MENFNDVSDAFDGWLQTVAGSRGAGSYVNGRWVESSTTGLSFPGVVQDATPDDLKVLDEGMRTEEAIKIHTQFQLIAQINGVSNGDLIFYQGFNWQVFNVGKKRIGGYFKAIAIRQEAIGA